MTANTHSVARTQADVGCEASTFALGTGMVVAALVGIWGTACLVSALINIGPLNVVKGYVAALVG